MAASRLCLEISKWRWICRMISRQGETGRDWKATMEYAVEEAETKGKAEGERLATLRNARNMKKAGVDLSLIAECTGLSLEIIQSL
ncbi:hypothetical protein [Parabacteroides goldsteinii]|uniref:hypothetical protein n=1 Tax=Parabacteroides goldsteinii TaxID=328812 RepID=UPI00259B4704|nr:hypothetical protein [Parabacteroides goldsteinii]